MDFIPSLIMFIVKMVQAVVFFFTLFVLCVIIIPKTPLNVYIKVKIKQYRNTTDKIKPIKTQFKVYTNKERILRM